MLQKIRESVDYIVNTTRVRPIIGILLGSGLGNFADQITVDTTIPYSEIPHFPVSGVEGHKGLLLIGHYGGIPLAVMQGRVHFYEGLSMHEVTFPVRVMKSLGVETLLLSNAAGGLNPDFTIGDLMIITDHIHLMPNPLIDEHVDKPGPRFPVMSDAYDRKLIGLADAMAKELKLTIKHGIYIGVTGPTYETPAEYAYFRHIGGDAVGMSTTPEVIVARQMGIRCLAVSVITDLGIAGQIKFLTHQMVQATAMEAEPRLAALFGAIIMKH
jgi:purine-nucleoside phosphorylase